MALLACLTRRGKETTLGMSIILPLNSIILPEGLYEFRYRSWSQIWYFTLLLMNACATISHRHYPMQMHHPQYIEPPTQPQAGRKLRTSPIADGHKNPSPTYMLQAGASASLGCLKRKRLLTVAPLPTRAAEGGATSLTEAPWA